VAAESRWPQQRFRDTLRAMPRALPRNDLRQYEALSEEGWRPDGAFAMLHWLARARAARLPPAPRPDAVLVDLGCGGGVLAPYVAPLGYRHIGLDVGAASLGHARADGVVPVLAHVTAVRVASGPADAVSAGEILEHVAQP